MTIEMNWNVFCTEDLMCSFKSNELNILIVIISLSLSQLNNSSISIYGKSSLLWSSTSRVRVFSSLADFVTVAELHHLASSSAAVVSYFNALNIITKWERIIKESSLNKAYVFLKLTLWDWSENNQVTNLSV